MTTSKPWWLTDTYDLDLPVPVVFEELAGPNGLALVKAWPSGNTDPGWGLNPPKGSTEGFMPRYLRGEFNSRRVLYGYNKDKWAFAFIMRAFKIVCVDIDGKNGGFDHVKKLGVLPTTMSERSKSGNGYHLFYSYEEDWNPSKGYGSLADRIGIEQGVDIRATGCVYHHKQQRWNARELMPLPEHLKELLLHKQQQIAATTQRITSILEGEDDMEILMMKDEIVSNLAKPIPDGKRNITLFALGSQLKQAEVSDWEERIRTRAGEIGLPADETDKLVNNLHTRVL